jgi:hypothetical protein
MMKSPDFARLRRSLIIAPSVKSAADYRLNRRIGPVCTWNQFSEKSYRDFYEPDLLELEGVAGCIGQGMGLSLPVNLAE